MEKFYCEGIEIMEKFYCEVCGCELDEDEYMCEDCSAKEDDINYEE